MGGVVALITSVAVVASSLAARSLARHKMRSAVVSPWSRRWRWGTFVAGILAGTVTGWWNTDAAWPLVLGGRIATFVGLMVVTPLVSADAGQRLVLSPDPLTSIVGARLRNPSQSLTRALSALAAGLFVLSAGATTVSSLGEDPQEIQKGYAIDGYNVVEVRRPSDQTRRLLEPHDALHGTNESNDPDIAGYVSGTCSALRNTVGEDVTCDYPTIFGTTYEGQTGPPSALAVPVPLFGPRAETLSGFVVDITETPSPGSESENIFIPLPVDQARNLYDQLVGDDYTANVRIAGAANVSGASELTAILDIFRWGAGFAVAISMLATIVSLTALLYDRQSGNNYLQILGLTRRQVAFAAVTEVGAAAGVTVAIALFSSWLWALSFSITADNQSVGIFALGWPFAAALTGVIALAGLMVAAALRDARTSVVPDRDGLVTAHDVFRVS
jgi:hypothetical protein